MAATAKNKDIDSSASPDEWKQLYQWVEERTLLFEETKDACRNPWLRPDISREQIIERIHNGACGGWMGAAMGTL